MKKGLIGVLAAVAGASVGAGIVGKKAVRATAACQKMSEKHLALFLMMNQWVKVKQEGKHLESYFVKNGYQKIAIYGMSYAGETLVDELKGTTIDIAYGIDQRAESIYADIDILSIEEELEKVDAIVVTAITFFDEIEEKLSTKVDCPIISLEDVLYEV